MSALPLEVIAESGSNARQHVLRSVRLYDSAAHSISPRPAEVLPLRPARTKVRSAVRPDEPRTYAAPSLRLVEKLPHISSDQNHADRAGSQWFSAYPKVHQRSVGEGLSAPRVSASAMTQHGVCAATGSKVGVASWAAASSSLITPAMKYVLLAGGLIGVFGVIFSLGLSTALTMGIVA